MEMKEIRFTEEDVGIIKTKKFSIKCPFCDKSITGTKKTQVLYNLQIHLDAKHKEIKDED